MQSFSSTYQQEFRRYTHQAEMFADPVILNNLFQFVIAENLILSGANIAAKNFISWCCEYMLHLN